MFDELFKTYDSLIFFDTETTGLKPELNEQIIELAAISIDKDGSEQEIDDFIKLHIREDIPENIVKLTGIMPLTLSTEGIDEVEAIKRFWNIKKGKALLIAHNAHFDLSFLVRAQLRHREELPAEWEAFNEADYLDTLTIYRDRRNFPHKLEAAISEYKLNGKVQNSHRAIDDCKALYEVAKKMEEEKPDLDKYINIFGFLKKYGPEEHPFKKVTYMPQDFNSNMLHPVYEKGGGA